MKRERKMKGKQDLSNERKEEVERPKEVGTKVKMEEGENELGRRKKKDKGKIERWKEKMERIKGK